MTSALREHGIKTHLCHDMFDLFDVWLILIMIKKGGKEKNNACV